MRIDRFENRHTSVIFNLLSQKGSILVKGGYLVKSKFILLYIFIFLLYLSSSSGQDGSLFSIANIELQSLSADKAGPMPAGSEILWTAEVVNPDGTDLEYQFELSGPSTDDNYEVLRTFSPDYTWLWKTTSDDIGDNKIRVTVQDRKLETSSGNLVLASEILSLESLYSITEPIEDPSVNEGNQLSSNQPTTPPGVEDETDKTSSQAVDPGANENPNGIDIAGIIGIISTIIGIIVGIISIKSYLDSKNQRT